MARKFVSKQIWDGASLASALVSDEFDVETLEFFSIALEVTGVTTNTGAFDMEVSNGGKWMKYSTPILTLTNNNPDYADNGWVYFKKCRFVFTPAGPTPNGTVTAHVCFKSAG